MKVRDTEYRQCSVRCYATSLLSDTLQNVEAVCIGGVIGATASHLPSPSGEMASQRNLHNMGTEWSIFKDVNVVNMEDIKLYVLRSQKPVIDSTIRSLLFDSENLTLSLKISLFI